MGLVTVGNTMETFLKSLTLLIQHENCGDFTEIAEFVSGLCFYDHFLSSSQGESIENEGRFEPICLFLCRYGAACV